MSSGDWLSSVNPGYLCYNCFLQTCNEQILALPLAKHWLQSQILDMTGKDEA